MKWISRIINIILFVVMVLTLTAAIGSVIIKKPFLLTAVRSNSMYPLFERSDMLTIKSLSEKEEVNIGDIVVFKSEEGSLSSKGWVVHRIISGNTGDGFITKGDANDYPDQAGAASPPIKREWIASKVITMGDSVIKIPLIGYLPIWVEEYHSNPYILPVMAVFLAVIVGVSELKANPSKKRKKKKSGLELPLIYMAAGLTVSIIFAGTMISTSQQINVVYEISDESAGVLMGSNLGILKTGDVQEQPLADVQNNSFFPVTLAITDNDPQVSESHSLIRLNNGDSIKTTLKLEAKESGSYDSTISVGMFYPFLPASWIYALSSQSYWLALVVISLIPGLPLIIYPFFDRNMRKKSKKEIRRIYRRISRSISF